MMAKVKQTIKVSTTTTKSKTKSKKNSGKRGNQKRCPACGRFI